LQDQFEILRSGRFADLPKALDAATRALDLVQGNHLDQETALRISKLAARNATISKSALGGVQSACARLVQYHGPGKNLRTYSRSGRSAAITTGCGSHKANY
jgi:hypothetical protein